MLRAPGGSGDAYARSPSIRGENRCLVYLTARLSIYCQRKIKREEKKHKGELKKRGGVEKRDLLTGMVAKMNYGNSKMKQSPSCCMVNTMKRNS